LFVNSFSVILRPKEVPLGCGEKVLLRRAASGRNQNYNPLYPPFLRGNLGREFPSNKRGVPPGRGVLKNFAIKNAILSICSAKSTATSP